MEGNGRPLIPYERQSRARERTISIDEQQRDIHACGQAVLALLAALRGSRRPSVARSLAELFDRRQLHQASEVLIRWASSVEPK